jgi:hypothetical protein
VGSTDGPGGARPPALGLGYGARSRGRARFGAHTPSKEKALLSKRYLPGSLLLSCSSGSLRVRWPLPGGSTFRPPAGSWSRPLRPHVPMPIAVRPMQPRSKVMPVCWQRLCRWCPMCLPRPPSWHRATWVSRRKPGGSSTPVRHRTRPRRWLCRWGRWSSLRRLASRRRSRSTRREPRHRMRAERQGPSA